MSEQMHWNHYALWAYPNLFAWWIDAWHPQTLYFRYMKIQKVWRMNIQPVQWVGHDSAQVLDDHLPCTWDLCECVHYYMAAELNVFVRLILAENSSIVFLSCMGVKSLCSVLLASHVLNYNYLQSPKTLWPWSQTGWRRALDLVCVWKGKLTFKLSSPSPIEKLTGYCLYAILHPQKAVDIFNWTC
jgi:hypothetical protein